MQVNELLLKPKKKKTPKKKVLKEGFPTPPPQEPINIGGTEFTPPFYNMHDRVLDKKGVLVCTCVNPKVAKMIADLMWEHM